MNGNRIWLDLAAFIDGPRGQSCVFVDHEKVKTVKDVEDHIRSLFKIESPFYISNDGWFLPSSESSLLLRDNDTVSVVPASGLILSHASQKSIIDVAEKDFISNIHQPGHSGKATQALSDRKDNVLNSSGDIASNLKNPFARPRSPEVPLDRPNVEEEQPNLKNPFARPSSSEVPSVKPHLEEAPLKNPELPNGHLSVMKVELDIGHSFNHESESAEKKRKRIRRRKRKSTLQVDEPKPKEPHQSRYVMNKLLQGVSHILKPSISKQEQLVNKKHIFFNDEECLKYDSNAAPQGVTEDEIGRDEIPVLPICTPPVLETDLSKLISLGNQKSPVVFERKKSENAQVVNPKPQVKLTPLNEMPVKEALFKFKILKMVNYSPTVSEQITARVISSDFSTQQIYVSILDGLNEFQTDNGKFSIEEDDSVEPSNPYKLLDWQSLIEPMSFV